MRTRHVLLATVIAAIWGFNFVVIKIGLDSFPPLLFAALRYVVAALPAVFFVSRPNVSWRWMAAIGLPLGVGQFGLLFIGMHLGMPAGLASLVLQSQALFTIIFARALLDERLRPAQAAGMLVAFGGVALIGADLGESSPLHALGLCVAGSAMWGLANVGMRRMNQTATEPVDAFAFQVWMALIPPVPLFLLSLAFEGPSEDLSALRNMSLSGLGALAYVAYISTLVGFGGWGWLMRRYDASTVAVYSLLVPPFGLAAAALILNEHIGLLRVLAATLIIGGVAAGSVRRTVRAPAEEPEPVMSR